MAISQHNLNLIPDIPPNGMTVLERRYLIRDAAGQVKETPTDLFRRVARFVAEGDFAYGKNEADVEALAEQFYGMLARLEFLPNSPTLMNAGRPLGQLSACFVLPIEDSMESIFETLKHTALIHQSGGGTGFSFSHLRPKGDVVRSTMGVSSGPVSFIEVYNAATEAIKQGGTRRGANMGILRIDHPDIEGFVSAKDDLRKVTNFNISVTVTDEFMSAVETDSDFALKHPNSGKTLKTLKARKLFDQIVDCAWRTGEPGLVFIDRINRDNPTPALGQIESTNPCGEVPLLAYEPCNLGSINLGKMLDENNRLDWDQLAEIVNLTTHFLDNVITQNRYPIPAIQRMAEGNRKIGLGVMGWADCLMTLGIPYDSEEALRLGREVAAWIDYHSKLASVELAKTRGPFPHFAQSRYATEDFCSLRHNQHASGQAGSLQHSRSPEQTNSVQYDAPSSEQPNNLRHNQHSSEHASSMRLTHKSWRHLDALIHQHGLRNATTTCIAPTGTISIIAGASGGIEPVFALVFTRNVMDNTRMPEVHPLFAQWAKHNNLYTPEFLHRIAAQGGLRGLQEVPAEIQRLFVTSFDVAPEWHVRMQAVFQEFTDNGVSKTINFPENATRAEVAETYLMAWKLGIKGITVYRNNSRQDQPMALETAQQTTAENVDSKNPVSDATSKNPRQPNAPLSNDVSETSLLEEVLENPLGIRCVECD